jgi:hypothetical protein
MTAIAYLKSDLFKPDAEDSDHDNDSQAYAGIRHVGNFKKVARFLVDLAEKEIKHGEKEVFTSWRNRAGSFKAQFLGEFKAYARHQYPFNLPVDEKKGVLRWWTALLGSDSTVILPVNAFLLLVILVQANERFSKAPRYQDIFSPSKLHARRTDCVDIFVADTCTALSAVRFCNGFNDSNPSILQNRREGDFEQLVLD